MTEKRHDTQLGCDKSYDRMTSYEKLRKQGVKPLIKHREFGD